MAESDTAQAEELRYSCIYFGYGSNLSPRSMKQRCPDSLFTGLAILKDWKWIINETGYANIIQSPGDEVYGSLCFLTARDEAALDESEGVPWLYEKMNLEVQRLVASEDGSGWVLAPGVIEAVCYVDVQRQTEGAIEKEYVVWIAKAIEDGVKCGMDVTYADKYLRKYLPPGYKLEREVMMIRTTALDGKNTGLIPRGFASWSRG